jgi:hypothetical protein
LRSNSNTPVRHSEDNQLLLWWFPDSATYMSPLSLKDILDFNLEIRQIYWKCLEMSEFSRIFFFFTWYVPFIYLSGNIERIYVSLAHLSCQNFRLVRQSKFYPKGPHMLCSCVRVTKPNMPVNNRRNFEFMEEDMQRYIYIYRYTLYMWPNHLWCLQCSVLEMLLFV